MNTDQITEEPTPTTRPILRRPANGRLLAGVAAGLADYFGIDVVIVRIVIATLALFGGAGVGLYLAAWLLIPEEGCKESVASDLLRDLRYH